MRWKPANNSALEELLEEMSAKSSWRCGNFVDLVQLGQDNKQCYGS